MLLRRTIVVVAIVAVLFGGLIGQRIDLGARRQRSFTATDSCNSDVQEQAGVMGDDTDCDDLLVIASPVAWSFRAPRASLLPATHFGGASTDAPTGVLARQTLVLRV